MITIKIKSFKFSNWKPEEVNNIFDFKKSLKTKKANNH